jgi:hypothetical protein
MRCYYCGNEIYEDSHVCPYCDKPVESSESAENKMEFNDEQVFSLEQWHKDKTKAKFDQVVQNHKDLEKRVEQKRKRIEDQRKSLGIEDAEKDPNTLDDRISEHEPDFARPDFDELVRILARDKKKDFIRSKSGKKKIKKNA